MERAGFTHWLTDQAVPEATTTRQLQEKSLPLNAQRTPDHQEIKRYQRTKLLSGLIHSAIAFVFTILIVGVGLTAAVENWVRSFTGNDYLVLLVFAGVLGVAESILTLPLRWYTGFFLEHKHRLSNQSLSAWFWERTKGLLVGLPLISIVLVTLFFCLREYGSWWWVPVGGMLFFFSVLLARIAPVFIFPLFYKFQPLEEGPLKERIANLCKQVGVAVKGIFVFNLSKTTKKANAAFTGLGSSKRIILGDTLVANFTDEEIETIFAHELGHYTLNHVWKLILVGTTSTFLGLFVTATLYEMSLGWFGFGSRETIAALPLLGLWLSVYSIVTSPLNNMLSRSFENQADAYAVRTSGNKRAFANALQKLGAVNMADKSPHPVIEFLFYSHPSLEKRIRAVEGM
ncbi:MAG: M48 family metallopeptidase [Bacteroidota bacterium]